MRPFGETQKRFSGRPEKTLRLLSRVRSKRSIDADEQTTDARPGRRASVKTTRVYVLAYVRPRPSHRARVAAETSSTSPASRVSPNPTASAGASAHGDADSPPIRIHPASFS